MAGFNMDGYVDVATRIIEFRTKHPEGSLQPLNTAKPYDIVTIGDRTFIVVTEAAYRTPDDTRPGVGMAWEQFPGKTPYTRDSELMNAETSAIGRAIVAVLAGDTKKGIASAEDVRNRTAERDQPSDPAPAAKTTDEAGDIRSQIGRLCKEHHWDIQQTAADYKTAHKVGIGFGDITDLHEFLSQLRDKAKLETTG